MLTVEDMLIMDRVAQNMGCECAATYRETVASANDADSHEMAAHEQMKSDFALMPAERCAESVLDLPPRRIRDGLEEGEKA